MAAQVGRKAALVAHGGGEAFGIAQFFQMMEDFRAATQGFAERCRAHGHNHKFLNIQAVIGMFAAVNHVHHGNGQRHRACAAQVAIQRQACIFGSSAGNGERHGEGGVCAQIAFVFRAVQFQHNLVNIGLLGGINADDGLGDFVVNVFYGFEHPFAQVAGFIAIAQF